MGEAVVVGTDARTVEEYSNSLFDRMMSDMRYKKVAYMEYLSTTALSGVNSTTFALKAWAANNSYLFHEAYIGFNITLKKLSNGSAIEENKLCAPINNVIGSAFSSVNVSLNERCITPNSQMYVYKCYLETLLGRPKEWKETKLTVSGWEQDTPKFFDGKDGSGPSLSNAGFFARMLPHVVYTDAANF